MECIFCKISEGKIHSEKIFENENIIAFLDVNPINPGHTLIIPKKHFDNLFEVENPVYSELFDTAKRLSVPLQKTVGSKRVGVVVEGFLVPHAHIHLIPINNGGELDFRRARKAEPQELQELAMRIKNQL